MVLSVEQQEAIRQATVGQRTNTNWHIMRRGRLTASSYGAVVRAMHVTPSLLKLVLRSQSLDGVFSVKWSTDNEEEGIKAFKMATGMDVQEGFCSRGLGFWVGTTAVLEVKCPYGARDLTIEETVKLKDSYMKEGGFYCLCEDNPSWHQVQRQLHITGRDICFFVV